MGNSSLFDLKRLYLLIRNDLMIQFKTSLVILVSIIFGLTLISLLSKFDRGISSLHQGSFRVLLVFGGYLLTSSAFKTLHQRNQVGFYLSLPASSLEKFLSRLILTSIGYIFGLSFLYFIFSLLAAGISSFLFNDSLPIFNPFSQTNLELMGLYIITQSIFILGAIHFKSLHFIKTLASSWVIFMVLFLFTLFMIWLVFDMPINGMHFNFKISDLNPRLLQPTGTILKYFLWFGIAPFFWLIAFLKLKEYEV
jgi:hypothetical protein